MVESFTEKDLHVNKVKMPWNEHLLKVRDRSPKLQKSIAEKFKTVTAQGFYANVEDQILVLQWLISQQE